MTTRLIVDDNRSRRYLRSGKDGGWHARTAAHAIALLEHFTFDEVWMDHDLADGVDIWPLVYHLAEREVHGDPWQGCIYIHSRNPSGVPDMLRVLHRRGYHAERASLAEFERAAFDQVPETAMDEIERARKAAPALTALLTSPDSEQEAPTPDTGPSL
jgi:hypothetical protein